MTLPGEKSVSERTVIMSAEDVAEAIQRMARQIVEGQPALESIALLGILRRGRPLAERLAERIEALGGGRAPVGSLATTLYRDDLRSGKATAGDHKGDTHFDFDVDGATVILVDDVIFAGRTARAALDEVMDYGRPRRIQLACLVDRGLRELPIQPDYLGHRIVTTRDDHVSVRLKELDGEDLVVLERSNATEGN